MEIYDPQTTMAVLGNESYTCLLYTSSDEGKSHNDHNYKQNSTKGDPSKNYNFF